MTDAKNADYLPDNVYTSHEAVVNVFECIVKVHGHWKRGERFVETADIITAIGLLDASLFPNGLPSPTSIAVRVGKCVWIQAIKNTHAYHRTMSIRYAALEAGFITADDLLFIHQEFSEVFYLFLEKTYQVKALGVSVDMNAVWKAAITEISQAKNIDVD